MKKRSAEKGRRKTGKLARTKLVSRLGSPVPSFAANAQDKSYAANCASRKQCLEGDGLFYGARLIRNQDKVLSEMGVEASEYRRAIQDALDFYDRAAGNIRNEHGWTADDVRRLGEIRKLV